MFSTTAGQRLPDRLSLDELPLAASASRGGNHTRAIQVTLPDGSLDQLVRAIKDSDGAQVSLGKKPAIFLDNNKTYPIKPKVRDRSFVFCRRPGEKRAGLSGVLSLKDAAAKAKAAGSEDFDENDPALLNLQQKLAEHAQQKESRTTLLVKDRSALPPAKSGRAAVKAQKAQSKLLQPHRQGLFDQGKVARSMPTSPSLSGMTPLAPSKPTAKQLREEALKTSLIHLLAVRAVSESYICKTLRCEPDYIKTLITKYGRESRLDAKKFDLSDRGYKELDVWEFDYQNPDDRQLAIDRAITAFDRQRISVSEPVWQMLLRKSERQKGKVLSKLNLRTGPVQQVSTPQIHVQSSGEGKTNGKSSPDDERPGRLAPSSAAVRSTSQEPPEKPKVSEKEVKAKRMLEKQKDAPKATSASAKASAKPAPKKVAPSKPATTTNSKFKSAEFIEDSDEDTEMEDTPIKVASVKVSSIKVATTKKTAASTTPKPKDPTKAAPKPSPTAASAKLPAASAPSKDAATKKSSPAAPEPKKTGNAKSESKPGPSLHKRTPSALSKPSRLGSSPPTNASDLDNESVVKSKSSSSSNSPLINQRTGARLSATSQPVPTARTATSSSSSDGTLKRKADDLSLGSERDRFVDAVAAADRPVKRRAVSPPRSTATSDTATDREKALSKEDLQSARRFKEAQLKYSNMLKEVRSLANPPPDRVERLRRMYSKLAEHKKNLRKLVAA